MILEKGCMHKRHLGSGSSPDQYTSTKGLVSLQKRKEARDNESEKVWVTSGITKLEEAKGKVQQRTHTNPKVERRIKGVSSWTHN